MISLVKLSDFFTLILPMFEFLLVFAGLLFLMHLKTKTEDITVYFRTMATDIRRIADSLSKNTPDKQ